MACIRHLPGKRGGWERVLDNRGGVPPPHRKEPWPLLSATRCLVPQVRRCEDPGRWIPTAAHPPAQAACVHIHTSVNMHSSYYTGCMRHTSHRKSGGLSDQTPWPSAGLEATRVYPLPCPACLPRGECTASHVQVEGGGPTRVGRRPVQAFLSHLHSPPCSPAHGLPPCCAPGGTPQAAFTVQVGRRGPCSSARKPLSGWQSPHMSQQSHPFPTPPTPISPVCSGRPPGGEFSWEFGQKPYIS